METLSPQQLADLKRLEEAKPEPLAALAAAVNLLYRQYERSQAAESRTDEPDSV